MFRISINKLVQQVNNFQLFNIYFCMKVIEIFGNQCPQWSLKLHGCYHNQASYVRLRWLSIMDVTWCQNKLNIEWKKILKLGFRPLLYFISPLLWHIEASSSAPSSQSLNISHFVESSPQSVEKNQIGESKNRNEVNASFRKKKIE